MEKGCLASVDIFRIKGEV